VALLIQHEMGLHQNILSYVASGWANFSPFSHKRQDFRKSVIECKICVLLFSTTLDETFLILRRTQRAIVIKVKTSSYKVPVIRVEF
jgi:hypothetical protein